MRLSKGMKIVVGLGTAAHILVPFIIGIMVVLAALIMPLAVLASERSGEPPALLFVFPFIMFGVVFPLQCVLIPLTFLLIAFYLAHIIKNTTASDTTRIVLAIGMVFMPYVAMPVYYLLHVWPEQAEVSNVSAAQNAD